MSDAPAATILLVEDDPGTADTVALYLRHDGHRVDVVRDGAVALERARQATFDLLVLDRMLPGVDGDAICREVRTRSDAPILVLSALAEERDRLEGFELGADDYVVKPFSPREVVARVRALLRRAPPGETATRVVRAGRIALDAERAEAWIGPRRLDLSPTEFRLLEAFVGAPGRVFSRDELVDRAVTGGDDVDPRVVDAHVKNLRRKLDPDRRGPSLIRTVFGRGYALEREVPGR